MSRDTLDYDQIQAAVRQGNGGKFQMFGGGSVVTGAPVLYDANGNAISGAVAQLVPTLPGDPTKYLDGTGGFTVPSGSGGSSGVIGTASFSAAGGSISNLVVKGVVSGVTRGSTGIFNLSFTSNQSNYAVSILANSNLTTPYTTYMNTTDATPPAAGFQFATVNLVSLTTADPVLVMVAIFKLP